MKLTKMIILIAICVGWGLGFTTEKHKVHKKSKFLNRKKKQSPNGQIFNEQSSLAQNTNIMDMIPDPDTSVIDLNIGTGPTYFKSWVKYFKYASDEYSGNKPRAFFKNMEFYQQPRKYPNTDLNKQKDGLNLYIKSEMYFYMLVFYDRVQILSSRAEKFQKTVESLTFDLITPVVEEKDFVGGVSDFGAFAEGFCFKLTSSKILLTQLPTNQPLTSWIICTDTAKEKLDLMTIIRKIKVKRQREQGIIITSEVPPVPPSIGTDLNAGRTPDLKNQANNLGVTFNSTTSNITDGYWIVLQDWSQCSLKCGGGVSTLQRMCVPPKNGGNTCDGPAILTKPCNIQPCPQVKSLAEKNKTQEAAPKKPIIKMMPFTDRPQRYTKCIVKESDLLFTKIFDEKDKARLKTSYVENLQMPARVVMNNRTVSIFQSTDYNSLLISFDLKDTTLAPSKNHKNCFVLTEGNPNNLVRQAELCPFGLDRVEMVFQEWAYDFNLFKFQCHADRETIDLDAAEAKALDDKYKKKVEQANIDLVEEKSKLIQDKLKKNNDMNVEIKKTNQLSMQAIQKELTLEDMIKREEEEREKEAEREMLQEIDNEKHKHDCLVKAIKEKELEDQYNLKTQAAEQQLKKIKDEAIKEVKIKRSELKSVVLKMRKRAERKKAILAQQLQAVRYQMANDMNNLYKDGDMEKCRVAMQNQQNRDTYCGINFPDDYVKYNNCKTEDDDFCTLCCETEFGNLHMDKRQKCIDTLCRPTPPTPENGRWVWTGDSHELIATNQLPPANPPPATPSPSFH